MQKRSDPHTRASLITNDIPLSSISGLFRSEDFPPESSMPKFIHETKDSYDREEVYGDYCTVYQYIKCPVDKAFEYAANPYSLEEWSYTVRDLEPAGPDLLCGREALVPNTKIYVKTESNKETGVVDYLCAWDQGQELWMRYLCRFVDAEPVFKKPGCVLLWTNCRHPNYLRSSPEKPEHIQKGQQRKDRPWVGDVWHLFKAGHQVEAENMRAILEARFPLTAA